METLSELVSRRLDELNLSKSDLARLIGKSRAYVTDLANGKANTQSGEYEPSKEVIKSLAKHLRVSETAILQTLGFDVGNSGKRKPRNFGEFVSDLEEMGISIPGWAAKTDFDNYTEDDFEELKERIAADTAITLRRKTK